MTTHELAKKLLKQPNVKVILSRDAEGNGYSPCSSVVLTRYIPESKCRGNILSEDNNAEDDDIEDVVVLFPNG
jgi:hypothetical protein